MKPKQLQSTKRECLNTKKGFSLIEAMLAVSIFGMLVTVLVGALIYGQRTTSSVGGKSEATALSEEALEAVRNIRDENFSNLSDGTYGLVQSGNQWVLSGSSDTTKNYTRTIKIETVDADRKKITARVEWPEDLQRPGVVELSTYLSDWQKSVVAGSCALTCTTLGHLDGTCRANTSECTTNSEINEATGDSFCTVNPNLTCCCSVPAPPADTTAPAAITNLVTSNATPSSVNLAWTAPGDDVNIGTAAAYDIRYSTSLIDDANFSSATQFITSQVPSAAGVAESIVVTGLNANTKYYFAIKTADESFNLSAISNIPNLTTLPPLDVTAPAAISNLSLTGATPSSITLNWTATGDDTNSGTATTYDIRYSTVLINDSNWSSATQATGMPTPSAAGSIETAVVNGLNSSTQYYFAIKVSDEVPNTSALSNVPNLTTQAPPDVTAPAAVSNLALSNPTQTTITLTWTAPGDDAGVGTATSYDVRYSTSLIDASNWSSASQLVGEPSPAIAGTTESAIVNGLTAGTKYYFAMKTSDEVPNISALSNVPSLSTLAAPDVTAPAAISNLALSNAATSSITLTWTAPGDDANVGTSTSYDIRYSTALITETNWSSATKATSTITPSVAGTAQTVIVNSLNSETNYYFAIKTSDEVPNVSSISNVPNISTLINVTDCNTYCQSLGYGTGDCGTDSTYCVYGGTGYIADWKSGGDSYCSYDWYGFVYRSCCCGPLPDTIPPGAITNLGAGTATGLNIPLTWTATADNSYYYGTTASYDLRYSTSLINDTTWSTATQLSGLPAPAVVGSDETYTAVMPAYSTTYYFAMKVKDSAGNISLLSNVVSATTGSNTAKVICTDAYRKGYIPISWLNADYDYADKYANEDTMRGYHAWGKPVVRIVQNNFKLAKRVYPMSAEWAKHTAYTEGIIKDDSAIGKMLIETAFPLCEKLGKMMREDGKMDYQFDDKDVEAVMEKYYQDYFNLGLTNEELVPIVKKDFEKIMSLAEETYLTDKASGFKHQNYVYEDAWYMKIYNYVHEVYRKILN